MHTHAYRRDWQAHLQPPPHPMSIQPGHELVRARMHVGNELKRWLGEEHIDPVAMDDTRVGSQRRWTTHTMQWSRWAFIPPSNVDATPEVVGLIPNAVSLILMHSGKHQKAATIKA
eukprot:1144380-Pelagomonas_calceolata.AAC.9